MRNSTAFFAGVVTVFSATALGFGGAMMLTTATTPHSTTEATKLERSVASPAKASPSADPKAVSIVNSSGTTQGSNQSPAPPAVPPSSPVPTQQAATTSPSAQTSLAAQTKSETPAQPTVPGAEQSTASSQANSAANAYARSNEADIRKYVHKRERHWARRHYQDEDATTAGQDAKSGGQSDRSQPSVSESQPAAQGQSQSAQIKTADQTPAAKIEDSDTGKVKRKHDRHWTRGYSREYGERGRDEDRAPSFEVREVPREDRPQALFGSPRWRPFFSDSDDDD